MAKPAGWSVLAEKALEIGALAFICRAMEEPGSATEAREPETAPVPAPETVPAIPVVGVNDSAQGFIDEARDDATRIYRASDNAGELLVAFYGDGRVRIADAAHRLAGMVQDAHADVIDVRSEQWSELFVRTTPAGSLQLELRGAGIDRLLDCEAAS